MNIQSGFLPLALGEHVAGYKLETRVIRLARPRRNTEAAVLLLTRCHRIVSYFF